MISRLGFYLALVLLCAACGSKDDTSPPEDSAADPGDTDTDADSDTDTDADADADADTDVTHEPCVSSYADTSWVRMRKTAEASYFGAGAYSHAQQLGGVGDFSGDADGDGEHDVVVAHNWYQEPAIYLYLGCSTGYHDDEEADIVLFSSEEDSVRMLFSGGGDSDGDGFGDLIQAGNYNTSRDYPTRIISGTFGQGEEVARILDDVDVRTPTSISDRGDIDQDGFDDILIAAYSDDVRRGRVALFHGPIGLETPFSEADGQLLAWDDGADLAPTCGRMVVTFLKDTNGDGTDDVLVSGPDATYDRGDPDYSYPRYDGFLFTGGISGERLIWDADAILVSEGNYGLVFVGDAGDVNGDGYGDALLTCDMYMDNVVYVQYGPFGAGTYDLTAADARLEGDESTRFFGAPGAVTGPGDVNQDGFADVVVGDEYSDSDHQHRYVTGPGSAYLFAGPLTGSLTPADAAVRVVEESEDYNYSFFGRTVSGPGDTNGDGYPDILVSDSTYTWLFLGWEF